MKNKKRKDYEDVDQTIKDIRAEKKSESVTKRTPFARFLFVILTPFRFLRRLLGAKKKPSLTTKTTIIFTAVFGALTVAYIVFAMLSLSGYLGGVNGDSAEFLRAMWMGSVLIALIFLFVGYVTGRYISRAVLRPIKAMSERIDRIDGDNLSLRLDEYSTQDELTQLARQINNMLFSLEQTFERQANFIADASHELKTPISVINGYSNLLDRWGRKDPNVLDEGLSAIARESANVSKIIDQMLVLAKIGKLSINKSIFDPPSVVEELIQGYRVVYENKRILRFESIGCVQIETDKHLFIEAVRTLIDNALKYSADDVQITVVQSPSITRISVKDYGIGIAEKDLPHIFNRFYRCDKTRGREKGSAGLGLTICKSIVDTLGGELVISSKQGEGTEAMIILGSQIYA